MYSFFEMGSKTFRSYSVSKFQLIRSPIVLKLSQIRYCMDERRQGCAAQADQQPGTMSNR